MRVCLTVAGLGALFHLTEASFDDPLAHQPDFYSPHAKSNPNADVKARAGVYHTILHRDASNATLSSSSSASTATGVAGTDAYGDEGYSYGALNEIINVTIPAGSNGSYIPIGNNAPYTNTTFDFTPPAPNATLTADNTSSGGLVYTNIVDMTNTFQLHEGNDSSMYITGVDSTDLKGLFAGLNNIYAGDSDGNPFIYYANEMAALNVSRFRVAQPDAVPTTARLVSLAPVKVDSDYVYAAVDTLSQSFFLAGCNIANSTTKVFLVTNPSTDLITLTRPELAYVITGGVVTSCGLLAFAAHGGSS